MVKACDSSYEYIRYLLISKNQFSILMDFVRRGSNPLPFRRKIYFFGFWLLAFCLLFSMFGLWGISLAEGGELALLGAAASEA